MPNMIFGSEKSPNRNQEENRAEHNGNESKPEGNDRRGNREVIVDTLHHDGNTMRDVLDVEFLSFGILYESLDSLLLFL